MATLKKYNLQGIEVGQVNVDEHLVNAQANGQMIKDYIIALRANARQWSACTKTRSEVNHTTKKPHPQKGGGRSRQGMLSAPQYRGGGRVFGPKPKFDQNIRINRKERRAAIRSLIGEKIRSNHLHIIETTELKSPKTKTIAHFLKKGQFGPRVLFLGESHFLSIIEEFPEISVNMPSDKHQHFIRSVRNLPKVEFALASNINGYDLVLAQDVILTEAALQELNQWLS